MNHCLQLFVVLAVICFASGQMSTSDYENCETFGESRLQVAWTVQSDVQRIDFLLCGCAQDETESDDDVYLAFGLSADSTRTLMQGADVTVAWVDRKGVANAVDYHLSAYIQCVAGAGACPDTMDNRGGCTDDVFTVSGFRDEFKQCIAFSRNYTTTDATCDLPIDPDNQDQYVVWAVGGLGPPAFKHSARAEMSDPPLHLGRTAINHCSSPIVCPDCEPFAEKVMDVRNENATFIVSLGPNAGERGYMAIADQAGWGNSIYLNGTLIPRLIVERGRTYTFICETGNEPSQIGATNYHPFYITDSKIGGRLNNFPQEQEREAVYAGFNETNDPIGIGGYCEYRQVASASAVLDNCGSFDQYLTELVKECRSNDPPGVVTWTPDENTPNTVYYQCATHDRFGYKITVTGGAIKPTHSLLFMGLLTLFAVFIQCT